MSDWQSMIDFIEAHQCPWAMHPKDGEWGIHHLDDPPHNRLLGPVFPRGHTTGLVSIKGEVQCTWGDIDRADMTFSVTKTYLAMVVGIAVDRGLIESARERVVETLSRHGASCDSFDKPHNADITWAQFLQFTSEWQGECCGVPDQVDHYRYVGMQPSVPAEDKGEKRPLSVPGTYWEYNDVRINQCAMLLTRVFQQSIPDVFSEHIMAPIGASDDWHWHGYDNGYVTLNNGSVVQSVPGGGHWGGGMVISVKDQFLLAQLLAQKGQWQGKQLLSREWVDAMATPCDIAPWYGYFLWLNTGHCISKAVSANSYFALGIGGQLICYDPEIQLLAIFRWIDPEFTEQILEQCVAAAGGC